MNGKHYTKETYESIFSEKENDTLEDLNRPPEESHHHSSRQFPSYQVLKDINPEDQSWTGLFLIKDKRGNPLPKELQGSFTDVTTAVSKIQSYINSTKEINHD